MKMRKKKSNLNLISDGVDFEQVPTSDRPLTSPYPDSSDIPAVIVARRIKQQKRYKVARYGLMIILVLSVAVAAITLLIFNSQDSVVGEEGSDRIARMAPLDADQLVSLQQNPGIQKLAAATANIGMKLYDQERKSKDGNLLFSPFSIESALAMVSFGSKGSTLEEIIKLMSESDAVSLVSGVEELKTLFGASLPAFTSNENFTIETANSLFLQDGFKVLTEFTSDLEKFMHTESMVTDYTKPMDAAGLINDWVQEKTRNKIQNFIDADGLGADTRMVLVNALYFKGQWSKQFNKQLTSKLEFHVADDRAVQADFMHLKDDMFVGFYFYTLEPEIKMFALRSRQAVQQVSLIQRQFGISAVVANKVTDPIQKLFLDKLHEYKAKSASGKVEPSPELQKELASELTRVSRIFGGGEGVDMTKFPEFTFQEPTVDPINMQ